MFVSQAEIDQINGRMRRRLLHLPLKRGRLGELKRCPVRKGGVYRLRPPIPHAAYVERASSSPTRARAVLTLIALCETPVRTATITITSVERHGDGWLIHFAKGDRASDLDCPTFLSKDGGYTMISSRQAVPGDPEVLYPLAEDLAKARAKMRESRVSPDREVIATVKSGLSPLQQSLLAMKARNRVRLILKQMDLLDKELSVGESATLPATAGAAAECPVAVEDADQPCGTNSVVSLESAA